MMKIFSLGTNPIYIYIYRVIASSLVLVLLGSFNGYAYAATEDIFNYPDFDFNSGNFIAGSGISTEDKKSLIPVGTVSIWTQDNVPEFWLECNGQAVDPTKYPELRKMMANVPDYRGRFLQGTDTGKNVGDRLEAGLPNIIAKINIPASHYFDYPPSGAFTRSKNHNGWASKHDPDDFPYYYHTFDASRSSSVYGKSTTVQPPSVIVKYIIKAE